MFFMTLSPTPQPTTRHQQQHWQYYHDNSVKHTHTNEQIILREGDTWDRAHHQIGFRCCWFVLVLVVCALFFYGLNAFSLCFSLLSQWIGCNLFCASQLIFVHITQVWSQLNSPLSQRTHTMVSPLLSHLIIIIGFYYDDHYSLL